MVLAVLGWGCGSDQTPSGPDIVPCGIAADTVRFGVVDLGDSLSLAVPLANGGDVPVVSRITVDGPDFHLRPSDPVDVDLAAGEDTSVTVVFAPFRDGLQTSTLRFLDVECAEIVLTGETPRQDAEFIRVILLSDLASVSGGWQPKSITVDGQDRIYLGLDDVWGRQDRYRTYNPVVTCTSEGVLVRGWPEIAGIVDGMAVGPDGAVYLVDSTDELVRTCTRDGELVGTVGLSRFSPGKFGAPTDVSMDENGFIYVTDPEPGRVQIFSRSGEPVDSWWMLEPRAVQADRMGTVFVCAESRGWSAVPRVPALRRYATDGLCVDSWSSISVKFVAVSVAGDGSFYALVRAFLSSGDPIRGIYEYGADGEQSAYWPLGRNLNDLVADPGGSVYVLGADSLFQYTADGDSVAAWPHGGVSLAQDDERILYLLDDDQVTRLTREGVVIDTWGRAGSGDGEFSGASGITVTPEGTILVAESINGRVQELTPEGAFLSRFGNEADEPGWPETPCDLAVAPDGSVVVTSLGDHAVRRFGPDGEILVRWGGPGKEPGRFDLPCGAAVGGDGTVFVWDTGNERVQVFDVDGGFVRAWKPIHAGGTMQPCPHEDGRPSAAGIAADTQGRVYLADYAGHTVVVFDEEGTVLGSWGGLGTGLGRFNKPRDVAVGPQGRVYVLDEGNRRVQIFRFTPQSP